MFFKFFKVRILLAFLRNKNNHILCFLLFYFSLYNSFTDDSSKHRLIALSDSLMINGDYDSAKSVFRSILSIDKNSIYALSGLGKIAFYNREWGDAKTYFGDVLKREPDNLEAHYIRGICYRETGVFKALLLRKLDWDKSNSHFNHVLSVDSSYRDVLYQYAQLLRYRGRYEEAVKLGHAQIRLRPDLSEPEVKLFRLYRYLIVHRDLNKSLLWLQQQPWDHSQFYIGEKFRREGMLDQADSVFQILLNEKLDMPSQPLLLSLARVYYELGKPDLGQDYFWQAVDRISSFVESDLVFQDVKYIITDEEMELYRSIQVLGEKIDFFHTLWIKRDPTPSAKLNVRLAEHYRRLIFAEKYYEYDGFRTWLEDPDKLGYLEYPENNKLNEEFNDKGLIYIRHGGPNDKVITAGEYVPFNESWLYYETPEQSEMSFHFMVAKSGNDWRFAPILTNRSMLEDRLMWGNIYYRLYRADAIDRLNYEREMAEISRKSVKVGLSTDRHTWPDSIDSFIIPFSMETFRGEDGKTLLELSYALPSSTIAEKISEDLQEIDVEKGFAIYNTEFKEILNRREHVNLISRDKNDFIGYRRFELEPGEYSLSFHAQLIDLNVIGGWKISTELEDYTAPGLKMSDIQLAPRVEPATIRTEFEKNGLAIYPNPRGTFQRQDPIHIYFEIYNLSQDPQGNTLFNIDYDLLKLKGNNKGITNLFGLLGTGAKKSVTIHSDRDGQSEFSAEYLAIDVSELDPGEYELTIKVSDTIEGETVERRVKLTLE